MHYSDYEHNRYGDEWVRQSAGIGPGSRRGLPEPTEEQKAIRAPYLARAELAMRPENEVKGIFGIDRRVPATDDQPEFIVTTSSYWGVWNAHDVEADGAEDSHWPTGMGN